MTEPARYPASANQGIGSYPPDRSKTAQVLTYVSFSARGGVLRGLPFDLSQRSAIPVGNDRRMERSINNKPTPPRKPRLEEARKMIEDYAQDLREIIKALLRRLN